MVGAASGVAGKRGRRGVGRRGCYGGDGEDGVVGKAGTAWWGRQGRSGTPLARAPSSIRAGLGEKCVLSDLCGVCVVAMATARVEVPAQ